MKKQYITPEMDMTQIRPMQLLAGSIDAHGDMVIDDTPTPDDEEIIDAASHEFDFDFDDFKQILLLMVFTLTSLFASAQVQVTVDPAGPAPDGKKHAMTLYLKNGGMVLYTDKSNIDQVTYLPEVGMKVYIKNQAESVDYLFSQLEKIVYTMDNNANANWEQFGWTDYPEAWRLEYPHLNNNVSTAKDAVKSQVVVKTCDPYGITYSLEWDNAKIANRWTCYELHSGNTMSNVSRHDDFKADPDVAVSSTLSDYNNSGFSRGHLCPSADRLCSTDQNKQTFFLTNMQPQYQSHNGGLWSRLESQVRDYATDDNKIGSHCDTLYVVKAATIADVASDIRTGNNTAGVYQPAEVDGYNKLLVPKYFYMALLHYNKATDTYRAIAFWTDHLSTTQQVSNLGNYAISIDKLEALTGLDFFCNLPDDIETTVEEEEPDMKFWKITKSE